MPIEVPLAPEQTSPEAEQDFSRGDLLDAIESDLPPPPAPPIEPDVTTTSTEDFSAAYEDIGSAAPEPAPEPDFQKAYADIESPSHRAASEIFGLPPEPKAQTPDFEQAYAGITNTPNSQQALDETNIVNPRQEEIRAPTAADQPALLLAKIGRVTDKLFTPRQSSGPIVSPEVARVGVNLFSGGDRMAAKILENLTGKPYQAAEQGVEESLANAISSFTVPEQIAGLLQFAVPGVAEAYAVNVVSKLPEQYGRLKESIERHGLVSKETAKAATEAGITDLFGFLAAKGAQLRNERLLGRTQPKSEPISPQPAQPAPEGGELKPEEVKPNAVEEIQQPESVQAKPESGIESGQTQEAGVSDSLQRPAEGEAQQVTPKLQPGEKGTAELFQGEDQPFNLAGETGTDFEARAREAKAKTASQSIPREVRDAYALEGFGPGAAAAGEKLVRYEARKFGERFGDDQKIAQEIRDATGNRFYEPIPNKVTLQNATDLVQERGIVESINILQDETNGIEPRVRSAMGQFIIKRLNEGYKRLKESNPKDADLFLNITADLAEWQMQYGTKLGQGVQSFAMWERITPEGKLLSLKRTIRKSGLPELTPEQEAEVLRLSHEIDQAAEGMPRDEATLRLSKYIANIKGFDAKEVPLGIYYGNMLSGYNTQIVNALDTFLNVVSEINGLAITNPRAAAQIYGGLMRGFSTGRLDALLALSEGRMVTDGKWLDVPKLMEVAKFGEKGGVPIKVKGRPSAAIKYLSETKPAYILRGWKYVSRLMAASDAVMFRGAKEARASLLAYREAKAEGLTGKALSDRVDTILGLNAEVVRSFEEQARSEGYTGTKAKVRVAELRDMSRPKEANADAVDFAGEATYNHEPHGALGYFANAVSNASKDYPALKLFVPFTRIVANVTNRGLNYTPWGFKRAFYGYDRAAPLTGDARAAMITRATVGTVGLTALWGLQEGGLIEINGGGPSDRARRRQLQATGWKPYSIKVGDHYYSYIYTPLGLGLSALGNALDAVRYNELSRQDAFTRFGYALMRIPNTIFAQSFLSGLSNLFQALSSTPGDVISAVKQSLSQTFGTFTTPSIVRDIYRLFDPTQYQTNHILGDLLRNTPFSAAVNQPSLNAFGEPVQLPSNRFLSVQSEDPAWRFIVDHELRVPVPDKYSQVPDGEGGKRRITPDEYYRYLKLSGQEVKQSVLDNMADWSGMDHDEAQKALNRESERIRGQVKRELFE